MLTANEYLTMLEQNLPLPPETTQEAAETFFPDFLLAMHRTGSRLPHLREITQELRRQRRFGPLTLKGVPKATADEAVRLVGAWSRTMGC